MEKECANTQGLKDHFEFTGIFCLDDRVIISLAHVRARNEDDFDGDDGEYYSPVEVSRDDDECGCGYEEFIRERVKELAEVSDHIARARKRPVDGVRKCGNKKEDKRDSVLFHPKNIANKGNACETHPRYDIGRHPLRDDFQESLFEDFVGKGEFVEHED